ERDLVPAEHSSSGTRGLLAVGGAAFDDPTLFAHATKGAAAPSRAPPRGQSAVALPSESLYDDIKPAPVEKLRSGCGSGSVQSLHFEPLTGAGREVRDIAKLWTGSPAEVLENRFANERAFKQDAPGHRVLHLATHGFFLGNDCTPVSSGTRSVGGLTTA